MQIQTEKDYYKLLNIAPEATIQEIEEAYQRAKEIYGKDSVALYSLYSHEEREALMETINAAYETLIDPLRRTNYNATLSSDSDEQKGLQQMGKPTGQNNINLTENTVKIKELKHPIRPNKALFAMGDMDDLTAEQYRVLYTKLETISYKNSHKIFAITSSVAGEGKTTTSLNLSYIMAHDFNKKVILVECDLKKPSLLSYFIDSPNGYGLIDVIIDEVDLQTAIAQVENTNLYLLPARSSIKNSCELLGSQQMHAILNSLKQEFDYILIDSPPILPLADMNIISKIVDGVVLIVRAGKTPKDIVLKAVQSLNSANIAGIVLNGANTLLKKYYY